MKRLIISALFAFLAFSGVARADQAVISRDAAGLPTGWTSSGGSLTATSTTSAVASFTLNGTINGAAVPSYAVYGATTGFTQTVTGVPLLGQGTVAGYFYSATSAGGGGSAVEYIGVYGRANGNSRRSYGVVGWQEATVIDRGAGGLFGCDGTAANPCAGLIAQLSSTEITPVQTAILVDNVAIAAPIAKFRDNGTDVVTIADGGAFAALTKFSAGTNSTITVDGATTFAVTTSNHTLACTGAETINTITGGVANMYLLLKNDDSECTLADDDTATAANAINLTGTATNDVGATGKFLLLFFDGNAWQQISESANN